MKNEIMYVLRKNWKKRQTDREKHTRGLIKQKIPWGILQSWVARRPEPAQKPADLKQVPMVKNY